MSGSWWAVSLSLLGRDIKIRQYIKGEQILEKVSASYRRGFLFAFIIILRLLRFRNLFSKKNVIDIITIYQFSENLYFLSVKIAFAIHFAI